MPRIAILASAVADQIAAGEVVERPASAVKELVENALDAGATSVEVDVEEGGRALLRVSDDGCGMDGADAALALARHATSKIREAQDLVGVASYGFRGEALPAIASVSRLTLLSAISDGDATLVRSAGGHIEEVAPAARRRGTTIEVRDLFYNVPARRKFLRSARSEWRAIADSVVTLSLTRPSVRLRVTSDGREALVLTPAASLRARVAAVWGRDYADRFVEVDGVHGPIHVTGLAERPGDVGTASRRAIVMVNGRAVRDIGVARAVESAYRSTLPGGVRPSFILSVTVPADVVDVNVHPAKAEVRFHDRWGTERAIDRIVQRALGTPDAAAFVGQQMRQVDAVVARVQRVDVVAAHPAMHLGEARFDFIGLAGADRQKFLRQRAQRRIDIRQVRRNIAKMMGAAIGQHRVDSQHIGAHGAVADGTATTAIVGGHAADGGTRRGGNIDRKPQAVRLQLAVEIIQHDAGLHRHGAPLNIQGQNAVQVF